MHDQFAHHCPTCTCLSDREVRERMRDYGHTCVWSSEYMLSQKNGRLNYNCEVCEKDKK